MSEKREIRDMKRIRFADGPPVNLDYYLEINDLWIDILERTPSPSAIYPRYYATIKRLEMKDGGILASPLGNGNTPQSAVNDLADNLAGKVWVVDAMMPTRREFKAPVRFIVGAVPER